MLKFLFCLNQFFYVLFFLFLIMFHQSQTREILAIKSRLISQGLEWAKMAADNQPPVLKFPFVLSKILYFQCFLFLITPPVLKFPFLIQNYRSWEWAKMAADHQPPVLKFPPFKPKSFISLFLITPPVLKFPFFIQGPQLFISNFFLARGWEWAKMAADNQPPVLKFPFFKPKSFISNSFCFSSLLQCWNSFF